MEKQFLLPEIVAPLYPPPPLLLPHHFSMALQEHERTFTQKIPRKKVNRTTIKAVASLALLLANQCAWINISFYN